MHTNNIPVCAPAQQHIEAPDFAMPANACDCHAHVFGTTECYPLVDNRVYTPPPASLEQYHHLLKTLGFSRGVIVQPSVYGTDNRATLDAVAQNPEHLRAVVVVDDHVELNTLKTLHEQGARGARVNLVFRSNAALNHLKTLANILADMGWHMQMLVDVSQFDDLYNFVKALPVPVVFDHMGHIPTHKGIDQTGFQQMRRLLEEEQCWVKLSGSYRMTEQQETPYNDVLPFAQALVDSNPERLVWATDWPHPHIPVSMPADHALLNMLADWVPDPQIRQRILVDNPAQLYQFD